MAILKFRVYFEEDDTVYRDIVIRHSQSFFELHRAILSAYEFDNIHQACFYRSNDSWQRGRAISLEKYPEVEYKVEPLNMTETTIGSEIRDTEQNVSDSVDQCVKGRKSKDRLPFCEQERRNRPQSVWHQKHPGRSLCRCGREV
jgi:hypothetical protein